MEFCIHKLVWSAVKNPEAEVQFWMSYKKGKDINKNHGACMFSVNLTELQMGVISTVIHFMLTNIATRDTYDIYEKRSLH